MSSPIDYGEGSTLIRTNVFCGVSVAIESPLEHANTGLHAAVQRGDVDEVRGILLRAKWNWWCSKKRLMTKIDKDGFCPVHIAAKEGQDDIMKEFVEFMPNCVRILDKENKTALHVAVQYSQLEVIKVLLPKDGDGKIGRKMVSDDRDKDGNTALHLAAIHEVEPQIMRELLKWPGVNVNVVNNEGLTALDIAVHSSTIPSEGDRRIESGQIKEILAAVTDCGRYSRHSQKNERKIGHVDTVVASLIATITFAAIFQIPGGMEDDHNSAMYKGARLSLTYVFRWFSILNTLALFTSLTVMMMWLLRARLEKKLDHADRSKVAILSAICLGVSIVCMSLAFLCAYLLIVYPQSEVHLSEEEESSLDTLLFHVFVAACSVPGLAWIIFAIMVVSKFSKLIFNWKSRMPTAHPFPKSVLLTWLVISLVVVECIIYFLHLIQSQE